MPAPSRATGSMPRKTTAIDSKVLSGEWTMAAWVEIPEGTSGGDRCILSSDNDLSDSWQFFVTSFNGRSNNLGFDFGAVRIVAASTSPPAGRSSSRFRRIPRQAPSGPATSTASPSGTA